jgi:hypothetical protein
MEEDHMNQPLDELLLGTERFPLLSANGYDWVTSVDASRGAALLFAEIQASRHRMDELTEASFVKCQPRVDNAGRISPT